MLAGGAVLGSFDDEEEERREAEEEARRAEEEAAERADAKNERDFRESLCSHGHPRRWRSRGNSPRRIVPKILLGELLLGEDAAKIKPHQEPERLAKVVRDFSGLITAARKDRRTRDGRRGGEREGWGGRRRSAGGGDDATARRWREKTVGEKDGRLIKVGRRSTGTDRRRRTRSAWMRCSRRSRGAGRRSERLGARGAHAGRFSPPAGFWTRRISWMARSHRDTKARTAAVLFAITYSPLLTTSR